VKTATSTAQASARAFQTFWGDVNAACHERGASEPGYGEAAALYHARNKDGVRRIAMARELAEKAKAQALIDRAVAWIAENDQPAEWHSLDVDTLCDRPSVAVVAEMFGCTLSSIAHQVVEKRRAAAI
jgi:hypothetical protein